MTYAPKKTGLMILVLVMGLIVAILGFSGQIIPFGASLVLCFVIWIVGAAAVHRLVDHSPK